jgi:hypothetical protein
LSAKAKRRQEKGLDRAEAVMDKKEKKVEKSKGRARTVQERAKAWEELNKDILAKKEKAAQLAKENWVDEEDDLDGMQEDVDVGDAPSLKPAAEAAAQSTPLTGPAEDDDEIL